MGRKKRLMQQRTEMKTLKEVKILSAKGKSEILPVPAMGPALQK